MSVYDPLAPKKISPKKIAARAAAERHAMATQDSIKRSVSARLESAAAGKTTLSLKTESVDGRERAEVQTDVRSPAVKALISRIIAGSDRLLLSGTFAPELPDDSGGADFDTITFATKPLTRDETKKMGLNLNPGWMRQMLQKMRAEGWDLTGIRLSDDRKQIFLDFTPDF